MSLLSISDYTAEEIRSVLELAEKVKAEPGKYSDKLDGKSLAIIFEKPSTRTRISFELAIKQLGGHSVVLHSRELQLGRGETVADTGRVLERYVDAVMARVIDHGHLLELDGNSDIPVINGLSDLEHPCQALADMLTISEEKGLDGVKVAYVGDGNNVAHSLMLACYALDVKMDVACPRGYAPDEAVIGGLLGEKDIISVVEDPSIAVADADVVYTDVWVSMGDEDDEAMRKSDLMDYQVNAKLMKTAKKDAVFMHCLPAHRGQEVTDEVMDSNQSVVFSQAENRLHAQKAVLLHELGMG